MLSTIYRLATDLGSPLITLYLRRRLAAGREDGERFAERFGYPSRPRPAGRLVWCHAASVGEAASLLLLIEKLHALYPDIALLMTTGTVTAARMMGTRLPPYAVHQYVPVDRMDGVSRFLDHWKPDLALWLESELWPNMLLEMHRREIPAVLLNARMSDKSFRNWHKVKKFAHQVLSAFDVCLAQTEGDRGRFAALGVKQAKCIGNLKYVAAPLPFDANELMRLRQQTAGCLTWLMASTHRGEEERAIAAHKDLAIKHPRLLTVIVPRHAVRGDEIAKMLIASGLRFARRSKGEEILSDTQIYLADTMGELGLFYSLCPVAVMGGSFVRVGGHNPIEPALLGSAIICGPHMYNFTEVTHEFIAGNAILQIQHDNEISYAVNRLLTQPEERNRRAQAAQLLANRKRHILDQIIAELDPWLRMRA
jgi:3-deoxy-D-manno-octulosonic-acid transferase